MINDEQIIRDEAKEFARLSIDFNDHKEPIDQFNKVKSRLYDFYSAGAKSLFLDEIKEYVIHELQNHRDNKHKGKSDPDCGWENQAEKLLFYIRQEVSTLPVVAHQRNPSSPEYNRSKVFVSYSHSEKEYLEDIKKHFKPFLKQIDFWEDSRIKPGQKWKEEIRKAIKETKIAILLLSADFLASDFILTNELPPLLKAAEDEGAVILIVIIKPCLFEEFDDLNKYLAMNPPNEHVIKMNSAQRDDLYVNLVRQTKKILEDDEKLITN